jgi:uncharacterized membrane protein YkoI
VLKYAMMIISCIMLSAYAAIGWGFAHEVKSADGIRVDRGNYADFVDGVPISMANAVRAALWSAPVKAFEMKLMKADAYLVYRVGILRDGHKKANVRVDATNSKVLKY